MSSPSSQSCLPVHLQRRGASAHRQHAVEGRKNVEPQKVAACVTGNQRTGIGRLGAQGSIAVGAVQHERAPL